MHYDLHVADYACGWCQVHPTRDCHAVFYDQASNCAQAAMQSVTQPVSPSKQRVQQPKAKAATITLKNFALPTRA